MRKRCWISSAAAVLVTRHGRSERRLPEASSPGFKKSNSQVLGRYAFFDPADACAVQFKPKVDAGTCANGLQTGDHCANLLELLAIDRVIEKRATLIEGRVDVMNKPYGADAVRIGLVNEPRRTEEPVISPGR